MKFVILISYDGLAYKGWQMQKKDVTVSKVLEDTFKATFHKKIRLIGASRTDSGVHAMGQVALVETDLKLDLKTIKSVWNNILPRDILIKRIKKAPKNFHPLKNVIQKTYYYDFFLKRPSPFESRYALWCKRKLDLKIFKKTLNIFVGTHDFRSFCTGDDKENTVRTIDSINLQALKKFSFYRIIIKGPRFLRHMIRRIVGAAFDAGTRKEISVEWIKKVLEEKNPRQELTNAKPHGLLLKKIDYKNFKW